MKLTKLLLIIIISLLIWTPVSRAEADYYRVVDKETDELIFQTGHQLSVGDYYLTEDNKRYEVVELEDGEAKAEFKKEVELLPEDTNIQALAQGLVAAEEEDRLVGLYNTHCGESYVPTSGVEREPGEGDVLDVAGDLAQSLERQGIDTIHSRRSHDPHDGGSYERSRRTAKELIEEQPDALLDIHRDGVPDPEEYVTTIDGKEVARVALVVGRQNPQHNLNSQFAEYLKAVADQQHPGLVKGILYADGKYNQDLAPRSLLLEMGTYTNSKDLALESTDLMASSIATLLYGEAADELAQAEGEGARRTIFWILLVAALGGGLLFIANAGGLEEAVAKVKSFIGNN